MLRTVLAAGAALTTGPALAFGTAGAATTRAAGSPRWPHLLQLVELLGRQDLLELRLDLSLEGRDLLLLIGGQVQSLLCAGGQQVKPALPAPRAALRTALGWRTITGRRRTPLVLSG